MAVVAYICMAPSGCGGDDEPSMEPGIDAPGSRPNRTVAGRMYEHYVAAPGVDEPSAANLSGTTFAVFVPDTMATISGSGFGDGTFRITNVPEGEYYLRVGNRYLARTNDTVDLDHYQLGRSDARPATLPTALLFQVTGLAAWQDTDSLELYSPTAGTAAFDMQEDANAGVPAAGATDLTNFKYDLIDAASPGMPSADHDDQITLTQLATQSVGLNTFRAIARAFQPRPFTVSSGEETIVTGDFMTPASVSLELTWDRSAFDAEIRAHSPGDEADTLSYLSVVALPDAHLHGYYGPAPHLVIYEPGYTTDRSTLTTTGWSYADPFPPTWTRFVFLEYYTYQFIGDVFKLGSISQSIDLSHLGEEPIQPIIGMPVEVKINGRDAFTAQTAVGLTPTISWNPGLIRIAQCAPSGVDTHCTMRPIRG